MGIRTTVVLDEDVLERIKEVSRAKGISFREALNGLLRSALVQQNERPKRNLNIPTLDAGFYPYLNYDDIEGLLEYGEGEMHR